MHTTHIKFRLDNNREETIEVESIGENDMKFLVPASSSLAGLEPGRILHETLVVHRLQGAQGVNPATRDIVDEDQVRDLGEVRVKENAQAGGHSYALVLEKLE